ncbi:MAG: hypothetical protein J6X91_00405 [Bacteroidales bacterium]|nr:hypothetical protein [Bacteroidales bacterium]MBP5517115.1 hypothetical protein [Bacteroidales bacterium]
MKRLKFPAFVLMMLCLAASCSVDKDYDLRDKNMDYKINAGSQVAVPVGSFTTIRVNALLTQEAREYFQKDENDDFIYDPQGKVLKDFELGHYEVHGLELIDLGHFGIPVIKFYITFRNSLPFDFEMSSHVIDSLGNPIPNVTAILDKVELPAATEEYGDGIAYGVLTITPEQTMSGIGFDGFNIILKVKSMPTHSIFIDKHLGIALKDVKIQLPQGINFKIKKKHQEE